MSKPHTWSKRRIRTARRAAIATALALLAGQAAQAHVVLTVRQASVGAFYTGALHVGHGCGGSATTALRVEIPAGVDDAKPQPKPGWTLEIEREPLASPHRGEGGETVATRAKAITWRGRLPDDEFDEFGLAARLPAAPGVLAFPVVQTCEQGETRWTEPPAAPGQPRPTHPAPTLTVLPKADDGMAGMDMSHQ
ncbi:YcnI family protein [Caulobacter sp. KR2-114]|uniref:YcnI family copper-binding membrane protein n=1 Tax=Caulobacter sp. KR2-114 TaxID=3400912 RepID=UPI003C05C2CF